MKARARAHPKHPLRVLLSFGLVCLLGAALPLAPYLLSEHGGRSDAPASTNADHRAHHGPHAPDNSDTSHSDTSHSDASHLRCLKCVVAVSSLPAATTATTTLPARGALLAAYPTPLLRFVFNHGAGARAPPVHSS